MACGGDCCGSNADARSTASTENAGAAGGVANVVESPGDGLTAQDEGGSTGVPESNGCGLAGPVSGGNYDEVSKEDTESMRNAPDDNPAVVALPVEDAGCEKSCCVTTASTTSGSPTSRSCCSPQTPTKTEPETSTSTTKMMEPSCCSPKNKLALSGYKDVREGGCCSGTATTNVECPTTSPCCAKEPESTVSSATASCIQEKNCGDSCCGEVTDKQEDDCCEADLTCADSCCGESTSDSNEADCCSGNDTSAGCCGSDKIDAVINNTALSPSASSPLDPEKGASGKEHIILSVSGMTCTGCETKLKRTLSTLNYVSNLRISLVLARAELDIVQGAATADDVIKHLQRTTEFKCERVSNQGSTLDLICSGDAAAVVNRDWPPGVLDVSLLSKDRIRVAFDAKVIGARTLLEQECARSLVLAPNQADQSLDAGSRHVRHMGFMTLLSAVLTIPVLVMAWAPLPERKIEYGSASLALATIVQIVIAGPFYPKAVKALVFSKVIEMDLLICLSTGTAYIFSVVSFAYLVVGRPLSTGEFFETSTLLVSLIMVGRWVASLARQKAAESVSIRALQAQTAILIEPDNTEKEIDARMLQYGDVFRVAPDSRIPTDGTVILGISEVDESMLTGESVPVGKKSGSTVIAGSINGMGILTVRLTRLPGDNTITTIACMVDEAKLSKPKIQDIADRVASYFVPVVAVLTIITFVVWVAIGVAVRRQTGSEATVEAITYAITVLIVSCPCAIGLAVPMVIVVASGVAAQKGVIFKSASSIEVAYKTTDVVFDKTGTLTMGKLAVVDDAYIGDDLKSIKSLLLGLVTGIKHPVSVAVATHLQSQEISVTVIPDVQAVAGKGVHGRSSGRMLRAGNSTWLGVSSHPIVKSMLSKGLTAFCFAVDNELVAIFGLRDTLRPDSLDTVAQLQQSGLRIHMLSGDDDGAVRTIAAQLGIPDDRVRSRCSPRDKQAYIKGLLSVPSTSSKKKPKKPVVMFVGDGTNDAVALAQATIGVHVSSGTDIAQSAADVVLVRSNMSCILTLIRVSRKAMHRVAFNFAWSFVYNLFAVLLGAGAFVNARIPPEYAGLGELVSVLPVIIAASLLRWSRI